MSIAGWLQIVLVLVLVLIVARPLGLYLASCLSSDEQPRVFALRPVEKYFYWLAGVDSKSEQTWRSYTFAMLSFSFVGFLLLYAIQRLQVYLPLNPQGFAAVAPDLALNTSISFVTNTNWQAYAGETTMSHFVQMLGLTVHNFASAATGLALAAAVTRSFVRSGSSTIGNFWVDITRITLYVLLPISFALAMAFVALGVPQTLSGSVRATSVEGAFQVISLGPVASQEAIKQLGTNGGGFFNANSSHPFENPNSWTNLLQIWSMLIISTAMPFAFGRMVGDQRQGNALLWAMGILLITGIGAAYWAEVAGNPLLSRLGVDPLGGNMEGKEVRFGQAMTALFVAVTTGLSCGAVNAMHDSLTPIGGLVPMFLIQLGEILPGGVGSGLYAILVMAIITVFIAGLMVGRSPEYLGKKIEAKEMKLIMLALLILPAAILGFSAIALVLTDSLSSLSNEGPHGLSEAIYAYASSAGNNGSAFGGLNANTVWFNTTTGIAMLLGRFAYIIPVMAVAGSLAAKTKVPSSRGTFPTDGPIFIVLLVVVILVLGGLQFFPSLALGPIVEHLLMLGSKTF